MRAYEFISPEQQIELLNTISQNTRSQIERDLKSQGLNPTDTSGDMPFDFFKRLLDVAWTELSDWLSSDNASKDYDNSASTKSVGVVPVAKSQSHQPNVKKEPVARPKPLKVSKPTPIKSRRVKSKAVKPKRVEPVAVQKSTQSEPSAPPKPQVSPPINQIKKAPQNPGQPLPRIKTYGTMGLMNR
jgi:hypothetical protein